MVTGDQIRAARALLRIEQGELARRARVSVATLRRVEAENGTAAATPSTIGSIQSALESAGAEFIEGGVRRRRVRSAAEREALIRDIMKIARRSARRPADNPDFSEADLYGEDGLPK
jgi:predicted transcriptional regulator